LEQAEQALASGQVNQACQLFVGTLEQIQAMENSPAKIALLERLVGNLGENVAYTSPLEQLIQAMPAQNPQAALAVLSKAFEVNQTLSSSYSASKARTFTALANYYIRLGQPDQSNRILGEAFIASNTIQGAELKMLALTGIAQAYINAAQPALAAPALERALQVAQTSNNPNPYRQAAALERIASFYAQIGQPERALQIVRLIQVPNYQPTVMLTIVDKYSETGQIERALELLPTIQQTEQKAIALATIAGRLTAQQPQQATQTYAEAVSTARSTPNANQVIANVALRYVETGGLVATADETIQAIADPVVQTSALGAITLFYAKAGQEDRTEARLTQVLDTLGTISEESNRNSARQQLIAQAVQNGRYDYALRLAQTIQPGEETPFNRVDVLTQIAERAIAERRYDAALQVTQAIPQSFGDSRNRLFAQIAPGLAQAGEFERALDVAQLQTSEPGFQARTLAVVAAQAKLAGRIEQSATLFNQAIQLANPIDYASTKAEVLGAIAQAYLIAGQPEQATQLLTQAITATESITDTSSRSYTLGTISQQLTFANQYRAALQVAQSIPEASERLAKLNEAIEKAVNAGDFTTVLAVVEKLDNPVFKTRWLVAIAQRYILSGERTQATPLLNQAFQTARTIPGNESQTVNVRGGENRLIIDDEEDRGSFLVAIALNYAQIGQTSQAQQVAQTLENATIRQQLIQQIDSYR
jgi:lipopolysaccharide biosynthesis regulator YciM